MESNERLADWFRQWRRPLRKFLMNRRSLPDADLDDIAQEVFLRLLRYGRTEIVECPQAYLYKIATNVAAEWSIRARYTKPHGPSWLAELSAEDEPEEDVARDVAQNEVVRALNTLTPRQREILRLQFCEALGYAEIAERLGTTRRSVKRVVAKSYERLRNELTPDLLGAVGRGRS